VPGAKGYHVQVASDTEFRTLLVDGPVERETTWFTPPATGMYAWRVAARDAAGRVGEPGFARRIFVEEATPRDLLVAPRHAARFGFADTPPRVVFAWQSAGDTGEYRVVVTRGAEPSSDIVTSVTTRNQQLVIDSLGEGSYRWGVYAVRADHDSPLFTEPRLLTIHK
jgi:hypothetical protein